MIEASTLLRHLRSQGFDVRADGGRLAITPWPGLDAELRTQVRQSNDGLLSLLRAEAVPRKGPRPDARPECGGSVGGNPGRLSRDSCALVQSVSGGVVIAHCYAGSLSNPYGSDAWGWMIEDDDESYAVPLMPVFGGAP